MNLKEARRDVYRAALTILLNGPMPTSERGVDCGTPESEQSAANHARWRRAWNELLGDLREKAKLKYNPKTGELVKLEDLEWRRLNG